MNISSPSRAQRWLVLAHIALALVFGVIVPPWEAHDETGHFAFINHLVAMRALPVRGQGDTALLDQSHQPPLYYLIEAALTGWIDRSDGLTPEQNNFAFDGSNRHGYRILLRTTSEDFPWHGTVLALHAARAVSALLGGLMVLGIACMAQSAFPKLPSAATAATAIAALNPQAIYMSSMVNNDVMVSLLGAWLLFWLVRLWQPAQPRLRDGLILGAILGSALLSKNSSLAMVGFAALLCAWLWWRRPDQRRDWVKAGIGALISLLLVSGGWFARNWLVYGRIWVDRDPNDKVANSTAGQVFEGLSVASRDGWLPEIFRNGFRTFWGTFGWGNIQMPDGVYLAYLGFTLIGLFGAILAARRLHKARSDWAVVGLMTLFGLSMIVLPLYRAVLFQSPQLFVGRYLMPALGAYCALLGLGWAWLLDRTGFVPWIGLAALVGHAIAAPFAYLLPVYSPRAAAAKPADSAALVRFDNIVRVNTLDAQFVYLQDREGSRPYARVTVDWQPLGAAPRPLALGVSVLGQDNEVLGHTDIFPAGGNVNPQSWPLGAAFRDTYYIQIEKPCAILPARARIDLSVYEYTRGSAGGGATVITPTRALSAYDPAGAPVTPLLGTFRIEPVPPVWKFWQPPRAEMGGIWLRDWRGLPETARPGDTLTLTLTYEASRGNMPEAKAFVQLLNGASGGPPAAQDDHEPRGGYYPTSLWVEGECVRENFTLHIPADFRGVLRAATGFYTVGEGSRFVTPDPNDNDLVQLGNIAVQP